MNSVRTAGIVLAGMALGASPVDVATLGERGAATLTIEMEPQRTKGWIC
jgi:hypothetical protein